jgi:hypothetical protein
MTLQTLHNHFRIATNTNQFTKGNPIATKKAGAAAEAATHTVNLNPSLSGHRIAAIAHSTAADHHAASDNPNQERYHRKMAEHHASAAAGDTKNKAVNPKVKAADKVVDPKAIEVKKNDKVKSLGAFPQDAQRVIERGPFKVGTSVMINAPGHAQHGQVGSVTKCMPEAFDVSVNGAHAGSFPPAQLRVTGGLSMKTLRDISQATRDKMPASDFAGPGTSFPIKTQADVDSAKLLIGHADNPDAVKAKIIAIAKRKGLTIPDAWRTAIGNGNNQYTKGGSNDNKKIITRGPNAMPGLRPRGTPYNAAFVPPQKDNGSLSNPKTNSPAVSGDPAGPGQKPITYSRAEVDAVDHIATQGFNSIQSKNYALVASTLVKKRLTDTANEANNHVKLGNLNDGAHAYGRAQKLANILEKKTGEKVPVYAPWANHLKGASLNRTALRERILGGPGSGWTAAGGHVPGGSGGNNRFSTIHANPANQVHIKGDVTRVQTASGHTHYQGPGGQASVSMTARGPALFKEDPKSWASKKITGTGDLHQMAFDHASGKKVLGHKLKGASMNLVVLRDRILGGPGSGRYPKGSGQDHGDGVTSHQTPSGHTVVKNADGNSVTITQKGNKHQVDYRAKGGDQVYMGRLPSHEAALTRAVGMLKTKSTSRGASMNLAELRDAIGNGNNQYTTGGTMPKETANQRRGAEPTKKDAKRISDIIKKGNGIASKSHALAFQMANAIQDPMKAKRRAYAAADAGLPAIANVFHARHDQLVGRAASAVTRGWICDAIRTLAHFTAGDDVVIIDSDRAGVIESVDDGEYDVSDENGVELGTFLGSELRAAVKVTA